MRIARVIAVAISATLFVSAGSAMADGTTTPAKKPAAKVAKPKKKAPPKAAEPEPTPEPAAAATPAPAPEPAKPVEGPVTAPETKAASTQTPVVEPKKDDGDKEDFHAGEKPISVAPLFGFGSGFAHLGVGVRAGYNITENLYVGGQFMYHFGYSYGAGLVGSDYSASVFYPSGEFGYDIKAAHGRLDIRPYGGLGLLVAHVSGPDIGGKSFSDTSTALAIYPGVQVTYDIPNAPVYVGGDMRLLFSTAGGDPSFGAFATAGWRF